MAKYSNASSNDLEDSDISHEHGEDSFQLSGATEQLITRRAAFLNLPPELRFQIYQYCIPQHCIVDVNRPLSHKETCNETTDSISDQGWRLLAMRLQKSLLLTDWQWRLAERYSARLEGYQRRSSGFSLCGQCL